MGVRSGDFVDAYRGGNVNNGSNMGAFYVNLNNWPSNTNWNIGAGTI